MEPITERDLKQAAANGAVSSLRVQQLENRRYSIIVKLTWRPVEQTLVTQRKKVRAWADLTRLLDHIKAEYGITSEINVSLFGEKHE